MIRFLLAFCFLLAVACAKVRATSSLRSDVLPRFEPNDVAFLMPLPANLDDANRMIGVTTQAAFGEVLPLSIWDRLPVLRTGMSRESTRRELHLVAVRLDPCFREGAEVEDLPCAAQIRFVLQPLFYDEARRVISTRDTAIHLFYKVEAGQLVRLARDIQALSANMRDKFIDAPLNVHPLAQDGYSSPTYSAFKNLLLSQVGGQRLSRVTFMTVAGADIQWTFGGFDIHWGRGVFDIVIPGTQGRIRQTITSDTTFPVPMFSNIVSAGRGPDNLSMFGNGERLLAQPLDVQGAAIFALHRVENPNFHNPGSVDCVSCHLATMAHAWSLERGLPSVENSQHSYQALYNVQNASTANPRAQVLRAFGYFNNQTAVSQRVLHEVDGTLRYLNR